MKGNPQPPRKTLTIILFSIFFLVSTSISAQYFGRNKVNYRQFDFKVLETPHFEIYHYLGNESVKNRIAQQSEQWYRMHQVIFQDTFQQRNPVIFYNNHADFQQTNAISGLIGVGTGGVTEGLKNRVIMPFMESNAQTDHVLGHELVHAFQYHMFRESDSLSLNSLGNVPLWMIEGLAEYMSIGYVDPHTAIWLRSAVLNNKLPTIRLLNNRPDEYFPYRWGQAFWAFTTGIWGDSIIRPLFEATGKYGHEDAFKRVLWMNDKDFSTKWQDALKAAYAPLQANTSTTALGNQLVGRNNSGKINIVPSISPDGKLMAFWSEKDIFNLDLFLADATNGRIIEKLTSTSFASHIDEFSSYESALAWSPDSRQVAFVVFAKGKNKLMIGNTSGKVNDEIEIPGIDGFSNPAWSPDGKTIVVTGLINGQPDLYAYNLETKTVRQLTDDKYAELHPSWSPDGNSLTFSTDRNSFNKPIQHRFSHDLAVMNYATGAMQTYNVFSGANNLNPTFSSDNSTIYFLSDRDGFRNMYSYNINSKELIQLTNLYTGITGITLYAPAISASRQTDQVLYSYYNNDEYSIYSVNVNGLPKKIVDNTTTNMSAAMLPPTVRSSDIVQGNLDRPGFEIPDASTFVNRPYKAKFKLDYLGNTGMGVTTGGFASGVSGGVNGIFSDILGNHQLFGSIAINGEVYDFGGQFAYINADNRINWGASVSHIPYLSGIQRLFLDTLVMNGNDTMEVANFSTDILRTFEDQLSAFAAYPFSQTRRLEGGASFARYYYRLDRYSDFYTTDLNFFIGSQRERQPTPRGFNFGQGYLAFVGDNSQFGVASPLIGHRFRFEAGQYFGVVNMQTLLGDYRKYFRLPPFTFATRNMYMGRFGKDAESGVLPPLYIGYPFFIRGYEATNFAEQSTGEEVTINDLIGSRVYIANAEIRLPFTGPERLSLIRSRFLFTELNLFTDGGVAWGNPSSPSAEPKEDNIIARDSKFIMSSGISMRINLFGYLVIEPYYAIPWQNGGFKNANFGLNFQPGW